MTSAKLWIGVLIAACVAFGCSKDKYGTAPYISLKKVNQNVVPYDTVSSLLTFTFDLTEKAYNPSDTLYVLIRVPNCEGDSANLAYPMTSLGTGIPITNNGNGFKGTMDASFSNGLYWQKYGYPDIESSNTCHVGPAIANDTAFFYFVLGSYPHYSDTVKAGPIVLLHG